MKILLAPDSFKHSMSASEACRAYREGILKVLPHAEVISLPVADGGEGTLEAVLEATKGSLIQCEVCGADFSPRMVQYIKFAPDTAMIELANICGLTTIPSKNPEKTTTLGVGQTVKHALDHGCKDIILCIGGSATNDAGIGLMSALGVRFLDQEGCDVSPVGGALNEISHMDCTALDPRLLTCNITIACDVDNPMCGPAGASYIYAPQKGADAEMVKRLEEGLKHFAGVVQSFTGLDVANIPHMGAAGGVPVLLYALCGAKIRPGIDVVMDAIRLDAALVGVDLVITGEGKTDMQTLNGKAVLGVVRRCKKVRVPVIVISGAVEPIAMEALYREGAKGVFSSVMEVASFPEVLIHCQRWLAATAENVIRIWSK